MFQNLLVLVSFLAIALGLLATARLLLGWSTVSQVVAFGAVIVVAWVTRHVNNRRRLRRYHPCSTAEFVADLGDLGGLHAADVLRARNQIAKELGVNPAMLAPQVPLAQIAKDVDFLGSSSVGIDNIEALVGVHDEDGATTSATFLKMSIGEAALAIAKNQGGRLAEPDVAP